MVVINMEEINYRGGRAIIIDSKDLIKFDSRSPGYEEGSKNKIIEFMKIKDNVNRYILIITSMPLYSLPMWLSGCWGWEEIEGFRLQVQKV